MPDKDAFFELFETTGWNDDYRVDADELRDVINKSFYHLSAYDDDKLVGFGRMLSDGLLHAVIFDVIVHPEYRKRGVGTAIMADIVARCRQMKIRDIQLFCARNKVGFYEKCGFKRRPDDGPGMEIKIIYD